VVSSEDDDLQTAYNKQFKQVLIRIDRLL
jgi:hypothetical protein